MIQTFKCGLCQRNQYIGTRKGLRTHLREEHRILNEITNACGTEYGKRLSHTNHNKDKQKWWIKEV